MSVKEIELAVAQLPEDEVWEFAKWFEEFQAALWDKEIEGDIKAGRRDDILAEGREEIRAGRVEPM